MATPVPDGSYTAEAERRVRVPSKRPMPTVRLRRLAGELRGLRERADLNRDDVSARTGINPATLYRLETARARPQKRTLMALLDLYGASAEDREALLELSREADVQGWLQAYRRELPEEYTSYIGFEAEARTVRNYESSYVPGLLQTEDYARAVIRGGLPTATGHEVEQRVRARLERQALLAGSDPLQLWAIIDEAALRRPVGGPDVMAAQIQSLVEAAARPNVTLQVIPYAVGAHPGMSGSFILLEFPDSGVGDVVYIDSMAGALFLEREVDVRRYSVVFDNCRALGLSPADSVTLMMTMTDGGTMKGKP